MAKAQRTWVSINSLFSNYEIHSGYKNLLDEAEEITIPLSPVPVDEKRMSAGGLIEGAEAYAEMHKELWEKSKKEIERLNAI